MARGTRSEYNGTIFLSKLEARIAKQLDELGVDYEYEKWSLDYDLPITKAVCRSCGDTGVVGKRTYTPDFFLNNKGIYLEVKGHFKPHDRKLIQIINRDLDVDLRMIFLHDNKVTKASNNRYSDWCVQRNIPYAVGEVPKEWIS